MYSSLPSRVFLIFFVILNFGVSARDTQKQLNNAFRLFWKAMGLAYANRPFSLLAKVLTKIAYEGGRVVICTPDCGCSGEHAYSRRMLHQMTVGRVQLPDGSIYVPEDTDTAM